jgi:hypothetical protein
MLRHPTISSVPEADPALDQRALFALGLDHVRRLSRRQWTDHNIHDPGITTLELLAYALTDLTYRARYPLEDLLAAPEDNAAAMAGQFFSARRILPGRAVSETDYRKLLIDLPDVKNAWLQPAPRTLYANPAEGTLAAAPTGEPAEIEVTVRGRYTVLVDYMDQVTTAEQRAATDRSVLAALHANRGLGDDFVGVSAVGSQAYSLCAEIDIAPDADADAVAAAVAFAVDRFLAPPVGNYRLAEMLEKTRPDGSRWTLPEIFEGPLLSNGFIDDEELAAADLRSEIRLSDVISVIMDLPGVIAIRDIVMNPMAMVDGKLKAIEPADKWRLPVPLGRQPRLCDQCGRLVFYKRNLPIPPNAERVAAQLDALRSAERRKLETPIADDNPIPLGRYRDPGAYRSFQHEFPVIYGLSEMGLSPGATPQRTAQALQLKAWLLCFDQVMANYLAQLAHVGELFSMRPDLGQSYFSQLVTTFPDWQKVYAAGFDAEALADQVVEPGDAGIVRRNRFLDHLLARYAEDFQEYVAIMQARFGMGPDQAAIAKCNFLQNLPEIAADRSIAYDATLRGAADLWNSPNVSGFERRIARLLDIGDWSRRNLSEVAYDTYAEIDQTPDDEFRFRVRHPVDGKILLSSSTNYVSAAQARDAMELAVARAQRPEAYQRRTASDGRPYFNIVDAGGDIIARRIEYFATADAMESAISGLIAHLRSYYSGEGLYVVEHILLLPEEAGDPFMDICVDTACTDCAEADPYTYRVTVVLPAFTGRFRDMDFRGFVEETLRQEMPAHILPRICWVNSDDMAAIEKAYRDWLAIRSGAATANRADKIAALNRALTRAKNVYPSSGLHPCGQLEPPPFMLGRTALGSAGEPLDS